VVDRLAQFAEHRDTTPAAISIKWLLCQPGVTSVIIGARRMDQLEANLAATHLRLSDDDLAELDALTSPPEQYPGWMIRRQAQNRVVS